MNIHTETRKMKPVVAKIRQLVTATAQDLGILKIVILGDSGVGKTSLLQRFTSGRFSSHYKSTLGADFSLKEMVIDGRWVRLQIWDTAGQERFFGLGSAFYRGADGCLLVYDATSPASFRSLGSWRDEFLIYNSVNDNVEGFPFVVVCNKSDLVVEGQRPVSKARLERWCMERGQMSHVDVSAKEGLNIREAFETVARLARQREESRDLIHAPMETIKLGDSTAEQKGRCSNC